MVAFMHPGGIREDVLFDSTGPESRRGGDLRRSVLGAAVRQQPRHGVAHGRPDRSLGLQFITQDVQDLLSEDSSRAITGHSGRALLQNAAFKLLLQQDAAAVGAVGDAFDLPEDLQRWLLSCPRGDGLLLARGNRFPVRIEATPEEAEVIEWRPGRGPGRPRR